MAGIVWGPVPADLVILHGFTQTGASWDGVVRELAGRYRALAPDLGPGPWEAELDRLEALADRIEAIGAEAFAREWAAQPLFADQPPEVAAAAHADRLRRSAAEHAAQLRGLGTGVMPSLWGGLGELAMPAVVLAGERDPKFVALARGMQALIPDAGLAVVPGAGHSILLEAPAAVAAHLAVP